MGNASGFEARELVESFGSGTFGTDGNVRVAVGGWFSAEPARLGDGLGVYVQPFVSLIELLAQDSRFPKLIIGRRGVKIACVQMKT
jgi:hypothetical protein